MTTQTILITGATAGIGRAAALYLAQRGHRVFATGRNESALASLKLEAEGLDLDTFCLDVTEKASIDAARATVSVATEGRGIDVLINNAGYGHVGPIEHVTAAELRAQFETNVFGLLAVTRAFLPRMRRRGYGKVINVSSIGGRMTTPFMGAYHASKYAVEALSDSMRIELARFGVQVVLVEPGIINTEFGERSVAIAQRYAGEGTAYETLLRRVEEVRAQYEVIGSEPVVIARLMERIVRARRPRARYVAPFHGKVAVALAAVVPAWLWDAVMRAALGLTRRNPMLEGATAPQGAG
jgi:short-subunit dehydrogenase